MKRPPPKPKPTHLVTKHYGNGMMHHVGGPTNNPEDVERYISETNHRKNYKGHVWISTWKLVETQDVDEDTK